MEYHPTYREFTSERDERIENEGKPTLSDWKDPETIAGILRTQAVNAAHSAMNRNDQKQASPLSENADLSE